jgi:hypothetical protein
MQFLCCAIAQYHFSLSFGGVSNSRGTHTACLTPQLPVPPLHVPWHNVLLLRLVGRLTNDNQTHVLVPFQVFRSFKVVVGGAIYLFAWT